MERKTTQDDVWGKFSEDFKLLDRGMVVAQGNPFTLTAKEKEALHKKIKVTDICPVWKDKLDYKSVTVICNADQEDDVIHWLSYVHGGDYSMRKVLEDGRIAFRSDYQCW